jgi:hypothetical protein
LIDDKNSHGSIMIDPASIAFDIDGVVADTMQLFLDIAEQDYGEAGLKYEDFTCYNIEDCLDLDPTLARQIFERIMDGNYTAPLHPMDGAAAVLQRLAMDFGPLLFVTARPYAGPMAQWLPDVIDVDPKDIEILAVGDFDRKARILVERNISCFIEDRLETCFKLEAEGITPVLFRQPWNRNGHHFTEVNDWRELEALIEFEKL